MKKILIGILSIFVFFACSSENKSNKTAIYPDYKDIVLIDKGDKFEFTDAYGTKEVVKNPSKVVIFDLGTLDTFEALGLEDNVIAVPAKTLPKYLSNFKFKRNVGSVNEIDLETINELQPDLIIISGRQAKYYDKLNQIAPVMYVYPDNKNFLKFFENKIISIATLYDKKDQAKEEIQAIKTYIDAEKKYIDNTKKALIIMTNANRISAFGPNSRFGIIHDIFGIAPADTELKIGLHGNIVNSEYLLEKNPDYIFVVDRNIIVKNQERAQDFINNPIISKTNAALNDKIIYLDPEYWYLSGAGLKSFKVMSEEVFKALK